MSTTEAKNLDLILDVKVELTVRIGSCQLPMRGPRYQEAQCELYQILACFPRQQTPSQMREDLSLHLSTRRKLGIFLEMHSCPLMVEEY